MPDPLIRDLDHPDHFSSRHIGPDADQETAMLRELGHEDLATFTAAIVPADIHQPDRLELPPPIGEAAALEELRRMADQNRRCRSYIGMGYHGTIMPTVIRRNLLENPGWYTQYTPYQAEIAQGRLESLLNFQTMVADLTGMAVANASLLDEATAAAEAVTMAKRCCKARHRPQAVFVARDCHPQTIDVVRTRCAPLDIEVVVGDFRHVTITERFFAVLLQYPATDGGVRDIGPTIAQAQAVGALGIAVADLLACCLLKPPGSFGADIVVGSAQRFGVPMMYGGPHAAFLATRDDFRRQMPGRLIGVSKDRHGTPALRMALQTREQHIRRDKATSNICTAQALLANIAAMYAVYHGPDGLRRIAQRVHTLACALATGLRAQGYEVGPTRFFDTVRVDTGLRVPADIMERAEERGINLRLYDSHTITIALDETTGADDVDELLAIFAPDAPVWSCRDHIDELASPLDADFLRSDPYLAAPVFNRYRSETEMMRYLRALADKDLSLTHAMIPLGSCTMKLNANTAMEPVSWPGFADIHPFAPVHQTRGYQKLFQELEHHLARITGFDAISLQPNAGAQGEYAGLLVISAWHRSRGEDQRDVCLIPTSAHGTNPASAVMAGFRVVAVVCDADGNIDREDCTAKVREHAERLGALMITYPSTHGVFEPGVRAICDLIHEHGGQVYMDGANMNAQVGLCTPRHIGADVCHLNLHKTFAIPHGGGGPGMGPIGVARHLVPFLPQHPVIHAHREHLLGAVSAAPWGSPGVLPISWAYIRMLGAAGLTRATRIAILNANYIAHRLSDHYPVLYTGADGLVAHECIIDLRPIKERTGIEAEDVAKRLMDYGFHAPTMSFPVAGTLMIEPTESETRTELDRFCAAMLHIHAEIERVAAGDWPAGDNPLVNAPHTAAAVAAEEWTHPYTRTEAAWPADWLRERKFWPAVGRIDNVFGDRNLICTCGSVEAYAEA
ncbi:MAG: aminomethyl-transferring glycine dehydrogenase [Planctomycetota bacterium]